MGQRSHPIPRFPGKSSALGKQQALGHRRPQHCARSRASVGVQAAGEVKRQHRRTLRIHPFKAVR